MVCVKFYNLKAEDAERYARRELKAILAALEAGLGEGPFRAVPALGHCGPLLLLEYVEGLTLQDVIAIRRSRPGSLIEALENVARLLAVLHMNSRARQARIRFDLALDYADKIIQNLSQHGVLQREPLVQAGLRRQLDLWSAKTIMREFSPCRVHGDATTSNFIFKAASSGVAALDWERSQLDDPAADVGRLLAETGHALQMHGASAEEARIALDRLLEGYLGNWRQVSDFDAGTFSERTRFYQAISSLRISRNGWLSRPVRTALVARGLALLA